MTDDSAKDPTPGRRRRRWWWAVSGIIFGTVLGVAVLYVFRPHVYSGAVLQSSEPAPRMDGLSYANGDPVDIVALRGDVVLVYFGYTYCPDVCPLTLGTVAEAMNDLGEDRDRVHMIMVTVDPERDTPEVLVEYVTEFSDDFRGVWGEEPTIRSVATRYGVTFEHEEGSGDGYQVFHTASLSLIDPSGSLRIIYPVGISPDELTADLRELLG